MILSKASQGSFSNHAYYPMKRLFNLATLSSVFLDCCMLAALPRTGSAASLNSFIYLEKSFIYSVVSVTVEDIVLHQKLD